MQIFNILNYAYFFLYHNSSISLYMTIDDNTFIR